MSRLAAAALLALFLAAPGLAADRPSLSDLEGEVMCPVCGTTLDQSDAPAARQIKRFIKRRIAAGDGKAEIKDALVANYGESILASPPRHGFGLLAWLVPLGGILLAAAALGWAISRWARAREPAVAGTPASAPLDPALERRLDRELARYDDA